jgi:hypothetical protein
MEECKLQNGQTNIWTPQKIKRYRVSRFIGYRLPRTVRIAKSRRQRWTELMARIGEIRNAYIILVGKRIRKHSRWRIWEANMDTVIIFFLLSVHSVHYCQVLVIQKYMVRPPWSSSVSFQITPKLLHMFHTNTVY